MNEAFGYRLGDPGLSAVSRLALVWSSLLFMAYRGLWRRG